MHQWLKITSLTDKKSWKKSFITALEIELAIEKNVLSSGNKQYVHAMYSINNNNPCLV